MKTARLMERRDGEALIDPAFVKAIGHPLRVEIICECALAPTSESEFRQRRKDRQTRQAIKHHFAILLDCGAIKLVHTERKQGGLVHFYGAAKKGMFNEEDFDLLPPALRSDFSALVVSTFMERAKESLLAGTLDSDPSRHLTWSPLRLDRQGFAELMERLDDLFDWLPTLKKDAAERLEESGEEPVHTTVAMFGFESPAPDREHLVDT